MTTLPTTTAAVRVPRAAGPSVLSIPQPGGALGAPATASADPVRVGARFVIDQHFRQRDRLGRLVAGLAYNPFAVGIGLDEDTAAFIGPDNTLEVEGSGTVTVVDASELSFSSMDRAGEDDPVCLLGLRVHILVAGATFNLHTRCASAGRLATRKT